MGVAALAGHLPAGMLDPIRMHVAAKRYLCFAEPGYMAELSRHLWRACPCKAAP